MAQSEAPEVPKPAEATEVKKSEPRRKIVVAVDGSEESQSALVWALKNVIRPSDKVHILHAQPPVKLYGGAVGPAHYMAAPMYLPPEYLESMKKHEDSRSKAILKSAKDKCKEYHLDVEGDVIEGEAREAICAAVEQLKADMLIIGSHGFGAVKRAFLGSVSDYCVHHAKCPVTVVRAASK